MDFTEWLEDMTEEFNNDFLGKNNIKINEVLQENNIKEL